MSKGGLLVIDAGKIFSPLRAFAPGRLIVEGNVIAEVGSPHVVRAPSGAERLDASNLVVTPGFIDPHIHGCGGADVMDGSFESLNVISRIVARHGTTAFLPTTVSSPPKLLGTVIPKLGALLAKTFDGARPAGIHLEGPFISAKKSGTHKAANILAPDVTLFRNWLHDANSAVRLVTVAPELEGIDPIISAARDSGVTVAMGHSNASSEEAGRAANRGMCYAVHTFNAMRELTHRDPGIVGAVLSDDRIFAEIIADGIHVNPAVIRIFARAKGKGRIMLVTDAISATDMPDGRYVLGADTVEVNGGICRDSEGRLAGSTLTQEVAFRNFVSWTSFTFEDALLGLTLNPARALKLERKGILEPGADADITILDENFRVIHTYVGGRLVWTNSR